MPRTVSTLAVALLFMVTFPCGCPLEKDAPGDSADSAGATLLPWYPDEDGDGYGDAGAAPVYAEAGSEGLVESADDCDDNNSAVYPGAAERCNALDDDCDGLIDNEAIDMQVSSPDTDGDAYGEAAGAVESCDIPAGYVETSGDCDDHDAAVNPAATEICNGVDDDCDNVVDDDPTDGETWYPDADSDGYGDIYSPTRICEWAEGWLATAEDCDDSDAYIYPGAMERCNLADDDCDGAVDEDDDGDDAVDSLCTLWEDHTLDEADVRLIGDNAQDCFGYSVIFAGDLNGDGYDDVAVGANESGLGGEGSGTTFVFSGPILRGGLASERAVAVLAGPSTGAEAGTAIAKAGDVNSDGYDDLWTLSPKDYTGGARGTAALMLGPLSGALALSSPDLVWRTDERGGAMRNISRYGDYDGDGLADAAFGSSKADSGLGNFSGAAWITLADGEVGVRALTEAAISLVADHTRDGLGAAIAYVGDTTGDGTEDLVVSGWGVETANTAGLIWVLDEPLAEGTYTVGDAATAKMQGEADNDCTGAELSGLGDMNGDGYADYAIGSEMESSVTYGAGAVYIVYGPAGDRRSVADADAKLSSAAFFGKAMMLGARGDVDGDSVPDLLVGAYYQGWDGQTGRAYLLRGPIEEGTTLLQDAPITWDGERSEDWAAFSVDLDGDTNRDGFSDILIGAPLFDGVSETDFENTGIAYLFFGQPIP